MRTALLIQITLYDEETRCVKEQLIETYTGQYGWEVENLFYRLGELVSKKVDPSHGVYYPTTDNYGRLNK